VRKKHDREKLTQPTHIIITYLGGVFFSLLQRNALENDFIPAGRPINDFLSVLVAQIVGNLWEKCGACW